MGTQLPTATVTIEVGGRAISVRVPMDAALRAASDLVHQPALRAAVLAQLIKAA